MCIKLFGQKDFQVKAYAIFQLYLLKLVNVQMDPYLALDEGMRLHVSCTKLGEDNIYGSQKDEAAALKSLSTIELNDQQLKDTLLTHLLLKLENLSEVFALNSLICYPCKVTL